MPELPEVETVVRTLKPVLLGRRIERVRRGKKALRTGWKAIWNEQLQGRTIRDVTRRGKWILVELSSGPGLGAGLWLVVHLGMTGRFYVLAADEPAAKHTHLVLSLDQGQELRFLDPRRFGSVSVEQANGPFRFPQESDLGPEPFEVNAEAIHRQFRKSRRSLKAILLDQAVVAGIGNIYADEALHEARIHPVRRGESISREEAGRLCRAIGAVLRRAIERKGSTISDFYFGNGEAGAYQSEFRVYDRAGQPCRRCRTPIRRIRLAGRSTHFCPRCQGRRLRARQVC